MTIDTFYNSIVSRDKHGPTRDEARGDLNRALWAQHTALIRSA